MRCACLQGECTQCGGVSVCVHQRQRYKCKECKLVRMAAAEAAAAEAAAAEAAANTVAAEAAAVEAAAAEVVTAEAVVVEAIMPPGPPATAPKPV